MEQRRKAETSTTNILITRNDLDKITGNISSVSLKLMCFDTDATLLRSDYTKSILLNSMKENYVAMIERREKGVERGATNNSNT
jgi:hypothetical protein